MEESLSDRLRILSDESRQRALHLEDRLKAGRDLCRDHSLYINHYT